MQITIAVITVVIGAAFLFFFKKSENKRRVPSDEEREATAQKTAQDFVNARDISDKCLYTLDNMIFAYIRIEGLCLELYSRQEQKMLCRKLTSELSSIRYPYKYISVSRPVDISKSLQEYSELHATAEGGRRQLLKKEMQELAEMVMSGETLERQHYISIWGNTKKDDERDLIKRAEELAKKFSENGVFAEVLERREIVRLCNLVNIPAYVHIESTNIDDAMTVLADR